MFVGDLPVLRPFGDNALGASPLGEAPFPRLLLLLLFPSGFATCSTFQLLPPVRLSLALGDGSATAICFFVFFLDATVSHPSSCGSCFTFSFSSSSSSLALLRAAPLPSVLTSTELVLATFAPLAPWRGHTGGSSR